MDTMKLLLAATVALLLGALALSWHGMNQGVNNASRSDLDRIKKEIDLIRAEQDKLAIERERQLLARTVVEANPVANATEIEKMKAEMEAGKEAIRKLEDEQAAQRTKDEAKMEDSEELLLDQRNLESKDSELRRARLIADALLMARVKEYVEDKELGGFMTLDVVMSEQVQVGTVLAIRRNTGILGRVKVTDVQAEGAIASPLASFGDSQPVVGDELILPPDY